MPNPDTSDRQILGGSSRENGMSPLPKQNKVFLVESGKAWLLLEGLSASILVVLHDPSFSMALPALVWGLVRPSQMCLMPWEGTSCKGCCRKSLATTLGKFHGPSLCSMVLHAVQTWADGGHGIQPHRWAEDFYSGVDMLFHGCKKSQLIEGVERAFGNWKSSRLRITEGLRHPKHRSLGDYTDWQWINPSFLEPDRWHYI